MLPVFEAKDSLLFYPVQYEGLEASPNIFYTGATTNQQILPGMDYLKEQGKSKIFLVGSDYVFPRTANKEIIAWAGANDVEIVGEEYAPLGHTDFATIVNKLKGSGADAVFNTLNGDSNVAFFKEYKNVGLAADDPARRLGVHRRGGGRWHRHRQHRRPAHRVELLPDGRQPREHHVRRGVQGQVRRRARDVRPDGGRVHVALPLEGAWSRRPSRSTSRTIQEAAGGVTFDAPEGTVTVNGDNHHIAKTALIGKIGPDGLIYTEWSSDGPIEPDPFLEGYDWAEGLS